MKEKRARCSSHCIILAHVLPVILIICYYHLLLSTCRCTPYNSYNGYPSNSYDTFKYKLRCLLILKFGGPLGNGINGNGNGGGENDDDNDIAQGSIKW